MASVAVEIVIIVALVLVNGLLAMSELALVSARRLRLKQRADQGDAGAAAALELAGEPNRFLSTAQIGITTVGIFAGAFGGATLAGKLAGYLQDQGLSQGVADGAAVAVVVLMITYLSLIIGELVPKRLALRNPERVASRVSRPMRLLSRLAAPVVAVLSVSTEAVLRVLRATSPPRSDITDEEIRLLLEQSTEAGIIDEAEEELAVAVFRLGDRDVADLLT
ncbi:MAG TPA: CNNM domain-containing protein, partial [Tepidiformaceae bacterium]|nr:CNNM domain-containing protein [Tepidiformaceae bacterium]